MELGRGYTDDGERMLVELKNTAHHAPIILKMGVPVRVCEHNIRSAVRAMLIGGVEETANIRLHAQYVEIVSTGLIDPDAGWIFPRVEPRRRDVKICQTFKAAVAITQVKMVRIRLVRPTVLLLDSVKAFRLRHIQRPQDQRVQNTKDH